MLNRLLYILMFAALMAILTFPAVVSGAEAVSFEAFPAKTCDCVLTGECTCGNACTCGLTVTDVQLIHEGHDCPNCGYKSVLDKHRTLSGGRHSHKCPQCGMEWAHADAKPAVKPAVKAAPVTAKPSTLPPLPSGAKPGSNWTFRDGEWVLLGAPHVTLPPAPQFRVVPPVVLPPAPPIRYAPPAAYTPFQGTPSSGCRFINGRWVCPNAR